MVLTDPADDYARGWIPFLGVTIRLDSHPFIPRTETEFWTEKAIEEIQRRPGEVGVLDLFAGSGAIGVATLAHAPSARVDFGEIDAGHFPTIARNVRENPPRAESTIGVGRAHIRETDVWSDIPGRYDFVLANPPYLAEKSRERAASSVTEYEPSQALFAGEDGLFFIRKLIAGLSEHLTHDGVLYLEHEPEQAEAVRSFGLGYGFKVESFPDQYGVVRFSRIEPVA